MILHISVIDKIATYQKRDGDIVCGNSGYQITFAFDKEWENTDKKTARFKWNDSYLDVEFYGDTCYVPIIKNTTEVMVGVYAGELSTTTPAVIGCKPSILCGNPSPHEDSDEMYASEAKEAAARAEAAADRAENAVPKDGVSPVIKTTPIAGGHRITITDVYGTKSFDVMDGEDGDVLGAESLDTALSGDAEVFTPAGLTWEQGSLWQGDNSASTTRIRTNKFTANKGDTILLSDSVKGKLKYTVHLMDKTSGSFVEETGWIGNGLSYVFDADYTARIVCSYIREATIEAVEGENFVFKALGQRNVDIDILQEHIDRKPLPSMFAAAHRGYTEDSGVAHSTIEDFQNAINHGYTFLETDVRTTSDGEFVLAHEDAVTTADGASTYNISETNLNTLLAYFPSIATLDEFLVLCKKYDVVPVVEMKSYSFADYETVKNFIKKIENYDLADRAFITSFDRVNLYMANGINPHLNLVWWLGEGVSYDSYNEMRTHCKTPNNRVYIGYEVTTTINEAAYNAVKNSGLDGIIVHTVDDETRLNEIIPYIAGFITNDILPFTATTTTVEVYDGSVSFLITFTIEGVEYQAEEGMTWGEWCDSEYNTDGYWISGGYDDTLVSSDFIRVLDNEGNTLHKDAPIEENGVYDIEGLA